jgi:hypothetical protein
MGSMTNYRAGEINGTGFKYEEFENLLASFYLSLLPLRDSSSSEDKKSYRESMEILTRFSKRWGVRAPDEALQDPRRGVWPFTMNVSIMLDMTSSFWRDFGIGANPETEDYKDLEEFRRKLSQVLNRHNIREGESKSLAEVVSS